ncbi:TetR/AcrR family transcriptional regulator [Alkalihalobacillus sp. 1P02AB]|uniref:TetR/AcrR family transcriptional regulator n=1 Tax=Alkalihalobacillus sp. 1P02AB TaxID=3132260 RepID=UPI0039A6F618
MSEKSKQKEKLLITASRLFQAQGYHGTGVKQIIEESNFPKGSLYYYFPGGKEELAIEAVKMTAEYVSKKIEMGLNKYDEPLEAIQKLIIDMGQSFQKNRSIEGVPIASVALESSLISEPLNQACQNAYRTFQDLFTQKLINSGYGEKRARELGIVLNSMIEGAFLISFTTGNAESLFLIAEQLPAILK